MHIRPIIAIALIISSVLLAIRASPEINNEEFRDGQYIHVKNIVIEFQKANANVYVEYRLSPFAESYVFLFGSKYLEPKIKEIFAAFPEVKIKDIEGNSASLLITNISRKSDPYYLHDSRNLGVQPENLTLIYPEGAKKNYKYPKSTPPAFYYT
jgi:hypothetical protein